MIKTRLIHLLHCEGINFHSCLCLYLVSKHLDFRSDDLHENAESRKFRIKHEMYASSWFPPARFLVMMNESPVMSLVFSFVVFTVYVVFLIRHLIQERQSRNKQVDSWFQKYSQY